MAIDVIGAWYPASLEVVGLPGMGKSALLRYLSYPGRLGEYQNRFQKPFNEEVKLLAPVLVEFQYWLDRASEKSWPFAYIYERLLQKLPDLPDFKEDWLNLPAPESLDESEVISKLLEVLRAMEARRYRPVFLLDDFDKVLLDYRSSSKEPEAKRANPFEVKLVNQLRAWRSSASFVICTEQKLAEIDSELASNLFGLFDPVYMGGLTEEEARDLLTRPLNPPESQQAPEDLAPVNRRTIGRTTVSRRPISSSCWIRPATTRPCSSSAPGACGISASNSNWTTTPLWTATCNRP